MSRIRKAAAVAAMVGGLVFAGAGAASADAGAFGSANNSPGVLSGNVIQVPISVDANVCGNSLDLLGALNPAFGNSCSNDDGARGITGQHETLAHDQNVANDDHAVLNSEHHANWAHEGWHHHDPDCC
jgi:hypothetical protein